MRERRDDEDAAVAEETSPVVVDNLDAAEMCAANVGDAVVLREAFVDERIIRGQQIEHASILAKDAAGEELRFAAESLAKILVEVLIAFRIGQHRRQVAEEQPLSDEIGDKRFGARIGQHPANLLFKDDRISQLA